MQFMQILSGAAQRDVVSWEHACGTLSIWLLQTFAFLQSTSVVLGGAGSRGTGSSLLAGGGLRQLRCGSPALLSMCRLKQRPSTQPELLGPICSQGPQPPVLMLEP